MQIDVRMRKEEAGVADVKLTILSEDRYVHWDGIVVREPRPGWTTPEVPPLESWEQPLCWVTAEQRERIESPESYKLLQEHVTRKFLARKRKSP